jgi:hypothetical protein
VTGTLGALVICAFATADPTSNILFGAPEEYAPSISSFAFDIP